MSACLSFFLVSCQSSTCPSTPKVLWARECAPTLYFFVVFTSDSQLSLSKSLWVHHKWSFESKNHLHKFIFQEVMHYTISFYVLIYLPSGQAIVQSILNPSFQLWRNVTCILRFMWLKITIQCSMGQSTILMGVLLMISNIFYNIWILVQTFHGKLGNAPLFFYLGCLGSPWWSSSPKL